MSNERTGPDEYVCGNREMLVKIIKHGNDEFVRELAMAAIKEYGDNPAFGRVSEK